MFLQTHSLLQKSAKQNRAATLPSLAVSGQDCTPITAPAAQAGTHSGADTGATGVVCGVLSACCEGCRYYG